MSMLPVSFLIRSAIRFNNTTSKISGGKSNTRKVQAKTHDSAKLIVPLPTEIASGNDFTHDGHENRSAKDGTNAGGHFHASTE